MTENKKAVVEVNDLVVHYETDDGIVEAVNNVSFSINKGEVLGLVGLPVLWQYRAVTQM